MPRRKPEWIGRTDDSKVPRSVWDALYELQGGKDAITGLPFLPGDKIVIDHKVPLKNAEGGNRQSNLQLITDETHKSKTAAEATARAKERRIHERDRGYVRPKKSSFQTNRDGPFKMKMDGTIEPRKRNALTQGSK